MSVLFGDARNPVFCDLCDSAADAVVTLKNGDSACDDCLREGLAEIAEARNAAGEPA